MSTLTLARTQALPRVNLLPPEIGARRRLRSLQLGLGAVVLAALVVVSGAWFLAHAQIGQAQDELDASQATTTKLNADVSKLAAVPLKVNQVAAARSARTLAMGQEVRWSQYLTDLGLVVPPHTQLDKLTAVAAAPAVGGAAASSTALTGSAADAAAALGVIGAVTFDGKAEAHNDVATFLDSIARMKKVSALRHSDSYFSKSERKKEERSGEILVEFKASAALLSTNLSHRFDDEKAGR